MTIRPTELAAEWDGRAFKPLAETETEPARKLLAARHGLASPAAFGPSMIGPGIGLCVENAEAVFRNVRIVPLNP